MQIKLSEVREYLIGLVKQGGPAVEEYEKLSRCLADLATIKSQGLVSGESIRSLFLELGSAMTPQTVQGFAFTKPRGYAGDFEIIERIYQQWISPSPDLAKWDHYFHAQSAPKAVRGRKQYFQDWLATWEKVNGNAGFRVLNIASGSARDVFEYFTNNPESKIHFDCVDQDANAITYAAKLCERFKDRIAFHHANALRFRPAQPAKLVWSAGLFDYLEEKIFVLLLRRLWRAVESCGELVIGNFSPENPTRAYMELFGEWILFHRNEDEMIELAQKSGIPRKCLRVSSEAEGVNLFLHARKE